MIQAKTVNRDEQSFYVQFSDSDHSRWIDDLCTHPDYIMTLGNVLKHDATTTVIQLSRDHINWVIKRYNSKDSWHKIRRILQTSRAQNCWHASRLLKEIGILTPRRVAMIEERWKGKIRQRSYFVSEYIEGVTLDRVLADPDHWDENLIQQTAKLITKLRTNGITHGDLKATNFIVKDSDIYLIDLDVTKKVSLGNQGLIKDYQRFMRNWEKNEKLHRRFERLIKPAV